MRIVSHWLSSSGDIDPCETGFAYGEFEDYKFTVEAGTGGGTACEQDFAFSLDDGTGNLQTLLFADDFEIEAGTTMSVEKVTYRVFNNIGEATTITIYEDDGGLPGNIVDTFSNVAPDSQTVIGNNFGFDAYDIVFTLPTVVELDSGIYWAAIQVTEGTDQATNYWIISNEGVQTPGQYSADGGVTWVQNTSDYDFSFKVEGECVIVGGGGGGFVCDDQYNVTNVIENGLFFGGTTNQSLAVDVIVGDNGFTVYGSNLNVFLDAGQTPGDLTFDFVFYDDLAGVPGSVVHTSAGTVEGSEFVGSNFGYDVHAFEVVFDDAVDFDANSTYWMEVESNGVAWESTSVGIFGSGMAFANDNTSGDWTIDPTEDLVYSLICESAGGPGSACEQVFFDADQTTGIGFSDGNEVANDIVVAAGETFTMQTMTFDVVNLGGEPTEFDLEIYEDNGSGGVGNSTGDIYHFDSSNMTFVENGTFSIYTQYTVTLTLPNIELTADASDDARYWLAVASELSTTGDFTYWVSYDYVTNPDSYPSWQYNDTDGWFEYVDSEGLLKEGIMTVSGICEGAGGGDECEWTVIVEDTSWGDEVEWELREMGGTVLLSGGGYGNGYYDEQTITAAGPLEFWITNDGFFGDNTPTYSVSNGTEVLVSGTLNTADTLTFSDLNCDSGGGGGHSDCISTIYDGGNNGSAGGAVYFDVTVGPEDIELTSFDLNTDLVGTGFSVDVYTIDGTHVGNETNQGAWTMRTSGSGPVEVREGVQRQPLTIPSFYLQIPHMELQ